MVLGGCSTSTSAPTSTVGHGVLTDTAGTSYPSRELVLRRAEGVSEADFLRVVTDMGARVIAEDSLMATQLGFVRIELPDTISNDDAVKALADRNVAVSIERNYAVRIEAVPNDSEYSRRWALEQIGAPNAWETSTGTIGAVGNNKLGVVGINWRVQCHADTSCSNVSGSYSCSCDDGYSGNDTIGDTETPDSSCPVPFLLALRHEFR